MSTNSEPTPITDEEYEAEELLMQARSRARFPNLTEVLSYGSDWTFGTTEGAADVVGIIALDAMKDGVSASELIAAVEKSERIHQRVTGEDAEAECRDREWQCVGCGVHTWPQEMYMVTDDVWAQAGNEQGYLCIGCLEDRLDRELVPADFPPLPLNDDHEQDTVRLRTAKGSGRRTDPLYKAAVRAVLDAGADPNTLAAQLGLDAGMLGVHVRYASDAEAAA